MSICSTDITLSPDLDKNPFSQGGGRGQDVAFVNFPVKKYGLSFCFSCTILGTMEKKGEDCCPRGRLCALLIADIQNHLLVATKRH